MKVRFGGVNAYWNKRKLIAQTNQFAEKEDDQRGWYLQIVEKRCPRLINWMRLINWTELKPRKISQQLTELKIPIEMYMGF